MSQGFINFKTKPAPEPTGYKYWWNKKRPAPVANQKPILSEVAAAVRMSEIEEHQGLVSQDAIRQWAEKRKQEWVNLTEHWMDSPSGIEKKLANEPYFIRSYYEKRVSWLKRSRAKKHSEAFLTKTVKKALLRLEKTRTHHSVVPHQVLSAYYQPLFPHLPSMGKRRIATLANEIANRLSQIYELELEKLGDKEEATTVDVLFIYRRLAREAASLRVNPPSWNQLKPNKNRKDAEINITAAFGAINRLINATWWTNQLWRLRCDWREDLFRASNQVHKKAHPYISKDGLTEWKEQKARNLNFFRNNELEDEDGNRVSLESMVLASVSNPALRRNELMTRMQGVEYVAQERGDIGMFYTITCPSRYHATNNKGRMNDKWDHSRPPEAQKYLSKVWANIGSKLNRRGLRVYGFRVAEPHHDSTPHWHLLLFMRPKERKAITRVIHTYATREDKHELVPDARARFNLKKMDPKKGSATAYIAKYISKNIDGYALDGELDDETGKPLTETAKLATAWASRYRIRQYQPIGQPPVTVWRELRKLNNQLVTKLKNAGKYDPKKPLLADPVMDNILAAADVGCWASFVELMGGVLTPRENYAVAICYEEKDEPNTYGEIVDRIYGVYSRLLGDKSKICTREKSWKVVPKKGSEDLQCKNQEHTTEHGWGFSFLGSFAAPWSSVNNSPLAQKAVKKAREIGSITSFDNCPVTVEKEPIAKRGNKSSEKDKKTRKVINGELYSLLVNEVKKLNLGLTPTEIGVLCKRGHLNSQNDRYYLSFDGVRVDGRARKTRTKTDNKRPLITGISEPSDEVVWLSHQLEPLLAAKLISTPSELIAEKLLRGGKLKLSDECYYLRNGVLRFVFV